MADEQSEATPTRSRKLGCAPGAFVAGVAMIVGGIYFLGRWDALNGAARAGAIILVMTGTLLALPLVALMVLKFVLKVVMGRALKGLGAVGEQMVAGTQAVYDKIHDFREATPADFTGLYRRYYDETADQLGHSGYRHLGDLVDSTIEALQSPSPPIRVLAAADGAHTVAIYHLQMPRFQMPGDDDGDEDADGVNDGDGEEDEDRKLICDVTTEFTDGSFLMTSNTKELNLMTPPPQLEQRLHPLNTPVPELVRAHLAEHDKLLAAKGPDVRPVPISTLEDAIASERRQQAVKNAFRKGIGYVDPEEIRRIASRVSDDDDFIEGTVTAAAKARRPEAE